MRVIMINDCSYAGETLAKYLPNYVHVTHLRRTRDFFSKTAGIAWKILSAKGDIYHCHYLLQDCWLALKLGKHPVLGHAHGTDVRSSIKQSALGRMVRYNLKKCNKIIVSTPNLIKTAREYNESAEYIPNLVNEELFYPKSKKRTKNKVKVLIASASDWNVKGTDKIIRAMKKIEEDVEIYIIEYGVDFDKTLKLLKCLGLFARILPPIPHFNMQKYYWSADVVIASIGIGGTLGMVALEAIACGRPVIANVSSKFSEYKSFPLLDIAEPEQIANTLLSLKDENLWKEEYEYLKYYHDPEKIVKKFMKIYKDLIGREKND